MAEFLDTTVLDLVHPPSTLAQAMMAWAMVTVLPSTMIVALHRYPPFLTMTSLPVLPLLHLLVDMPTSLVARALGHKCRRP